MRGFYQNLSGENDYSIKTEEEHMYYNNTQISDQIHNGYKRFYDILEAWEPPNMEMELADFGGTDKERKNFKLY